MKKNVSYGFSLLFSKGTPINRRPASSLELIHSQHLKRLWIMMKASPAVITDCNLSLPTISSFHHQANPPPLSSSSSLIVSNFKLGSPLQRLLLLPKIFHTSTKPRSIPPLSAAYGDKAPLAEAPAKSLRRILDSPGVHQGPACFDALSAQLVEKAGFEFCFTSGFSISAARLGLPDVGLISYGEMLDQGRQITQAVSIPVIGDGDTGYGNAMNVKRTVKDFIRAGFAGIILEDQVSPKACGHTRGRKVVSRAEAVMRIKAAIDARNESGSDLVIVARTDSFQAVSFDESLWRSRAFADAGADVLFIDALSSKEEMKAFCEIAPFVPKLANMLEGGGKTPILNPIELEDVGYKLVVYPLSLIGVSIRAMQDALIAIKGGRIPSPGSMPTFEEIKETLGFNSYYEEEKRYTTIMGQVSSQRGYMPASSNTYSTKQRAQDDKQQIGQNSQDPVVEVITPDVYYGPDGSKRPFAGIWSRTLRIKITGRDGIEKLDVRIPAGFLEGITNVVPALGGVNIKALLDDAAEELGGKILLDFNDTVGDRIQVFLE